MRGGSRRGTGKGAEGNMNEKGKKRWKTGGAGERIRNMNEEEVDWGGGEPEKETRMRMGGGGQEEKKEKGT